MIAKLIVSHGNLARELVDAARAIAGSAGGSGADDGLEALCLDWREGCDEAETRIADRIAALDDGDGVLILTDMFGDTPCNAALACVEPGRVEVVTGVNLPMVARLGCPGFEPAGVTALAEWIAGKGRDAIRLGPGRVAAPAAGGQPGGGSGR